MVLTWQLSCALSPDWWTQERHPWQKRHLGESWRISYSYLGKREWVDIAGRSFCLLQILNPPLLLNPSGQRVGDNSFRSAILRMLDYRFSFFKNSAQPFVSSLLLNPLPITQFECEMFPVRTLTNSMHMYMKDRAQIYRFHSTNPPLPSPSSQSPSKEATLKILLPKEMHSTHDWPWSHTYTNISLGHFPSGAS